MESEENKISVWVCREEKLVFGLSKRTTCADVVKVLLEDQNFQHSLSVATQSGNSRPYCIVEKWRGSERILPNKTKILRLWGAWGEEQENVRFVLVKNEAFLANYGPRSAEARVVLSKQSPCVFRDPAVAPMGLISPEKQRRVVRKAFRKLEKINKRRAQAASKDATSAEKMETLVHLVISQDHTIRQQIQRIKQLDAEIERYEAKVHFDRIERHGINYVQDTYLVDAGAADAASSLEGETHHKSSVEAVAKLEEYARRCEEVVKLQEELSKHEALMDNITVEIQEELNHRWMKRRQEEIHSKESPPSAPAALQTADSDADAPSENVLLLEEERIKTQLDTSLYIGLRLNTDLEAIRSDLNLTQEIWGAREREIRDLLEKVNTLDIDERTTSEVECDSVTTGVMCALESKREWVEQARGLSKSHSVNDDDSDTGLSSMHSQDSDSLHPVCESLV
ncbi:ras association domain-containing protein 10 [Myripristis murdjan]|uniref:ras association domain-containing protein 10 n=1 Tax=Myripristis murdjan TaxID=586833 RepID=UPI0011761AD3|nr:ras association domain-containing protein 10-like [Myripristis murdjan]